MLEETTALRNNDLQRVGVSNAARVFLFLLQVLFLLTAFCPCSGQVSLTHTIFRAREENFALARIMAFR